MTTDNFRFYLKNRVIQTSQTGGQWYSDTSPFSIPWFIRDEIAISKPGNTKGGSIIVLLTSCLTGLE
jgi:hypothetical protein